MTIEEAVQMVDRLKPNQYDHEQKVKWLSKLDGMIWQEVIMTHERVPHSHHHHHHHMPWEPKPEPIAPPEDAEECLKKFEGYAEAFPDTELLVPFPYDEDVYNYFLQMQIDKENGEMQKYNQSSALFNNAYKLFCDWYNRTHLPLPAKAQLRF